MLFPSMMFGSNLIKNLMFSWIRKCVLLKLISSVVLVFSVNECQKKLIKICSFFHLLLLLFQYFDFCKKVPSYLHNLLL